MEKVYFQTITVIIAVCSTAHIIRGLYRAHKATTHASWTKTSGSVSSTEVKRVNNDGYQYVPYITYLYEYRGKIFQGSGPVKYHDDSGTTEREAQDILQQYPRSGRVTVYYNPLDPREATLQPGNNEGAWEMVMAGCFFLGIAIWSATDLFR
jgi:hypothetical protein